MAQTALALLRHLIADVDSSQYVLSDETCAVYLSLNGISDGASTDEPIYSIRRAAADALDAIAVSETLVGKVIRTQDLSTDGTKVAGSLREQANRLRTLAYEEETLAADEEDDGGGFFVAEFSPYPYPEGR